MSTNNMESHVHSSYSVTFICISRRSVNESSFYQTSNSLHLDKRKWHVMGEVKIEVKIEVEVEVKGEGEGEGEGEVKVVQIGSIHIQVSSPRKSKSSNHLHVPLGIFCHEN